MLNGNLIDNNLKHKQWEKLFQPIKSHLGSNEGQTLQREKNCTSYFSEGNKSFMEIMEVKWIVNDVSCWLPLSS